MDAGSRTQDFNSLSKPDSGFFFNQISETSRQPASQPASQPQSQLKRLACKSRRGRRLNHVCERRWSIATASLAGATGLYKSAGIVLTRSLSSENSH